MEIFPLDVAIGSLLSDDSCVFASSRAQLTPRQPSSSVQNESNNHAI